MKNTETLLGNRLFTASEYIREGAVLCDVGTDHAKLPIRLVLDGKIKGAYATDINEGPIRTAQRNVDELGLSESIHCFKTDGLLNTEGLGITDIAICGMGGELIASILSECNYIKDPDINLVLQPMTHTQDLRKFLYDNGFIIKDEKLTKEAGKLYLVISASYSGKTVEYTPLELFIGKILQNKERDELFFEMCERTLFHLENKKKSSDREVCERSAELYLELKKMLETLK